MNTEKNPAVIRSSIGPSGSALLLDIDGNTSMIRSRNTAIHPMKSTTTKTLWRVGGRPVNRLRRYENGISAPITNTKNARSLHGSTKKRRRKNLVSAGTLPYQITRYCEKKKYIHMMHIAKVSLATSWIADGERLPTPRAL